MKTMYTKYMMVGLLVSMPLFGMEQKATIPMSSQGLTAASSFSQQLSSFVIYIQEKSKEAQEVIDFSAPYTSTNIHVQKAILAAQEVIKIVEELQEDVNGMRKDWSFNAFLTPSGIISLNNRVTTFEKNSREDIERLLSIARNGKQAIINALRKNEEHARQELSNLEKELLKLQKRETAKRCGYKDQAIIKALQQKIAELGETIPEVKARYKAEAAVDAEQEQEIEAQRITASRSAQEAKRLAEISGMGHEDQSSQHIRHVELIKETAEEAEQVGKRKQWKAQRNLVKIQAKLSRIEERKRQASRVLELESEFAKNIQEAVMQESGHNAMMSEDQSSLNMRQFEQAKELEKKVARRQEIVMQEKAHRKEIAMQIEAARKLAIQVEVHRQAAEIEKLKTERILQIEDALGKQALIYHNEALRTQLVSTQTTPASALNQFIFNPGYVVPRLHNPHNNCFIHTVLQLLLNCTDITQAFFKPESQDWINKNPALMAYRDFAQRISLNKNSAEATFSTQDLEPLITAIRQQFNLGASAQGDLSQLFQSFLTAILGLDHGEGMIAKEIIQIPIIDERRAEPFVRLDVAAPIEQDQIYIAQKEIHQPMTDYLCASLIGAQALPLYLNVQVERTTGETTTTGRAIRNGFVLTDIEKFYNMGILPSPAPDIDFNGTTFELIGAGVQLERAQHCVAYIKKDDKWLMCSDSTQKYVSWNDVKTVFANDAQLFIFKKVTDPSLFRDSDLAVTSVSQSFSKAVAPAPVIDLSDTPKITPSLLPEAIIFPAPSLGSEESSAVLPASSVTAQATSDATLTPGLEATAQVVPVEKITTNVGRVHTKLLFKNFFKHHDLFTGTLLLAGSAYIGWQIYSGNITHKKLASIFTAGCSMAIMMGKIYWNTGFTHKHLQRSDPIC